MKTLAKILVVSVVLAIAVTAIIAVKHTSTETTTSTIITSTEPNVVQAGGMYGDLKWGWKYGTLTISGEGAMTGTIEKENICSCDYPWNEYAEETTKIVVEEGVTTIGERAFEGFYEVETVVIANTVRSIGNRAFQYCESLETTSIPSNCTTIGEGAFAGCYNLVTPYPNNAEVVEEDAFAGVNLVSIETRTQELVPIKNK